jgi:hypothetical protein
MLCLAPRKCDERLSKKEIWLNNGLEVYGKVYLAKSTSEKIGETCPNVIISSIDGRLSYD